MPFADRISQRGRQSGSQPISYLMQEALARPELISLAAGFVDQATLPVESVRAAVEQLLRHPATARAALQYGTTIGDPRLRELIAERLLCADGGGGDAAALAHERMIITAGSNELLHLLVDTLCDPGDIILCAAPSYFVFLGAVASIGARSMGVASDEQGLIPEAVGETLDRLQRAGELPRVKAIYLASYYDNPAGTTLTLARRRQLVEAARRASIDGRIWIIDDAAYRDLRYYHEDVPSLMSCDPEAETVIYTGSFSKSFSPGIRVGYGVLPRELVEPVVSQKGNIDFGSPYFNQRIMAQVIADGLFDEHVECLRASYRAKLEAMLEAADQHLASIPGVSWIRPGGGLYIWLTLPPVLAAGAQGALFQRALAEGVLYVPGEHCFPVEGEPVRANTMRLSFGVQPPDRIARGIEALGRAIRHAMLTMPEPTRPLTVGHG